MNRRITIVSGKGGAGKSTLTSSLAAYMRPRVTGGLKLADGDVEEPNLNLFFGHTLDEKRASLSMPVLDRDKCTGCGECAKICNFNAVVMLPKWPHIFTNLCHACGGCSSVCTTGAIVPEDKAYGTIGRYSENAYAFYEGRLDPGEILTPYLIRDLIKEVECDMNGDTLFLLDAPPGAACAASAAISGSDKVLVVVEDSPFGIHDAKVVVELIKETGIPFALVANKLASDSEMGPFCQNEGVELLATVPEDLEFMKKGPEGSVEYFLSHYGQELEKIALWLQEGL